VTRYSEEPPRRRDECGLLELGEGVDAGSEGGGAGTGEITGVSTRRAGVLPGSGIRIDSKGVIGVAATGVRRAGVRGVDSGGEEGLASGRAWPVAGVERARLKSRQHVGHRHSTTSDPSGPW
jgi:hypothetical protein